MNSQDPIIVVSVARDSSEDNRTIEICNLIAAEKLKRHGELEVSLMAPLFNVILNQGENNSD